MFLLICITLLLINLLLLVNACPQYVAAVCRCEELHNGVSLNCSSSDGVPTIELLRANQANLGLIQQLTVQNAQLTRLPAGFFSGLYIKKLDLSHNRLYEIHPNAFLGMNNVLQELRLNHNNLTVLPATALIPLTTLLRLDLSNNSIGDLQPENALPSLPKVLNITESLEESLPRITATSAGKLLILANRRRITYKAGSFSWRGSVSGWSEHHAAATIPKRFME
ncbi:Leucine-rich repeat-containing protein 3 [Toxocara canis]|uniref:Leucine-rich repeat-containing protein 3 n=1 Tax=Toxocara canis TaxID=6265 RepID=A0A0B2VMQ7_TOXCA|nr:Leucine-rich repeat-containing protein 3 [Toxocara canis]